MKTAGAKHFSRRQFLRGAVAAAGGVLAAPYVLPGAALGKNGAVVPSEQIALGGIGIGNRGSYDLGCFLREPDVRFLAICDVKDARRKAVKKMADSKYGNEDCAMYRDFRELLARPDIDAVLIATGPNWHATASIAAAKAGKDVYCEKPCTKNIVQSLMLAETFRRTGRVFQGGMQRRNLPHVALAVELARTGKLGKLQTVHAHPGGMGTGSSGWLPAEPEPPKEEVDWDLYLGPAAWRPFNRRLLNGFNFEKGGGLVGGGVLEWGSHCVDLCQWANSADDTAPVEYEPPEGGQAVARYANGVRLVVRGSGWLPLGSCPVRFEGDTGWVETGDNGDMVASSPALLAARGAKVGGYPANNHIRDFLNCVKTRGLPRANHDVACHTHIACHAVGIAIFLKRKVTLDPRTYRFVGDEEANRLRSEALREPWRL
ncbi:MAG TPA: Gfo/Idh/MocA family oxidoreductase [Phycisphaerae bacterium]|nr:Gfo/Idh/MocA family oxidoreductase [Phycisphaerae bacterium]